MKTFNDLTFKADAIRPDCFRSTFTFDNYVMSITYGPGMYGKGPAYDTYEVALFQDDDSDDLLPLSYDSDVLGWQNGEEITSLMKIVQTEPDFGTCLKVLKRTKYARRFNNISHMRDEAFA